MRNCPHRKGKAMLNYEAYRKAVEDVLYTYLPPVDDRSAVLGEAMRYSLSAGGKRLRPALTLAAADLAGGNYEEALPFAVAVEYIHTYSLIHDDLPAMDDDDLRRGKPSNHKVYGAGMATLAGDGLLHSAFQVMAEDVQRQKTFARMCRHAEAFIFVSRGSGVQGMVAGQATDISVRMPENKKVAANLLHYIQQNKTGALLQAALQCGLAIGGAPVPLRVQMNKYMEKLAAAFQVKDDILDVIGKEDILGKSIGSDREDHKFTAISLYGLEEAKKRLLSLTEEALAAMGGLGKEADFFRGLAKQLAGRVY